MKELQESIEARIALYEKLEKKAQEKGDIDDVLRYISRQIGLREALIMMIEIKGRENKGE